MSSLADTLMATAFSVSRDPRSDEYKAGCRAALEHHENSVEILNPYKAGSAARDAFFAGVAEGHAIWRAHEGKG